MPKDRATVVWPEDIANVKPRIEVPRPIGIPWLDESAESAVRSIGVPDVEPIARLAEIMGHVGRFSEALGYKPDTEIVVGVFQQAGRAPKEG